MSVAPARMWGPVQLTASNAVLGGVVPPSGQRIIKRAVFTNVVLVPVSFTVYVVRSGQVPDQTNVVISNMPLSSNQSYIAPELSNMVLNPGDAIEAVASVAASINTVASGFTQ